MAAFLPLLLVAQEFLLAGEVERVSLHREPRERLPGITRRRIETEDVAVLRKFRVEREAEEAVFLVLEDLDLARDRDLLRLRVVDLQLPAILVEEDASIRRDLEFHRLRHIAEKPFHLETIILHLDGEERCRQE